MAVDFSQFKMIPLNDNQVSRMLAEKAIHDQTFRDRLLEYASFQSTSGMPTRAKRFEIVNDAINNSRKQLAEDAELEAPKDQSGQIRDLNTYLKQLTHARVLVLKVDAQEVPESTTSSEEDVYEWGWVGNSECLARLASSFLESTLRFQADPSPFPFERLPPELRLHVYREALRGPVRKGVACGEKIVVSRNRSKKFQYRFVGHQKGEFKDINVGLLATSRLLNHEAIPVLYQLHTFDFGTNVSTVMPFMCTLSEATRQNLRGMSMELHKKSEPDYCCGGFDKAWGKGPDNQAAWGKVCTYIAQNAKIQELCVTTNVKVPAEFKSLKWVKALAKIKGLKRFMLKTYQHYGDEILIRVSDQEGSLASSRACYSEHLEHLFEYLREEMLE